jgi:hypothetical protein
VHEVQCGWTADEHEDQAPFLTFVQIARGCVFTGSTLMLLDLAPVTVCIGPPPEGSLSRVTTSAFLDLWWLAAETTPRAPEREAVVALVDPDRRALGDVRVRLSRPRIHGSGLQFDAGLVQGLQPASSGSCALFIEPAATTPPSEVTAT